MTDRVIASTLAPNLRTVELIDAVWAHIVGEHPEMRAHLAAVLTAVRAPDYYEVDVQPGRERYFKWKAGPDKWLRVVVEFRGDRDAVVTAFGQSNSPLRKT